MLEGEAELLPQVFLLLAVAAHVRFAFGELLGQAGEGVLDGGDGAERVVSRWLERLKRTSPEAME